MFTSQQKVFVVTRKIQQLTSKLARHPKSYHGNLIKTQIEKNIIKTIALQF